jgi:hypothetical protein
MRRSGEQGQNEEREWREMKNRNGGREEKIEIIEKRHE